MRKFKHMDQPLLLQCRQRARVRQLYRLGQARQSKVIVLAALVPANISQPLHHRDPLGALP